VRPFLFLLPAFCLAQTPTIGIIEIYGARKVPAAEIRKVAGVAPGAKLPGSKYTVEERLQELDGVEVASLEAACCDEGKVILYIGIQESGGPALTFREHPTESPDFPEAVQTAYSQFLEHVREAGRSGGGSEDLSQGHSLFSNPAAREAQLAFIPLAKENAAQLRDILRRSSDSDHRAMAAYVLGYHPDKKSVLEDLSYALSDPDPTVRGNAIRAVAAIAVYAENNRSSGIAINPGWFVDLLDSAVWTDRHSAAVTLVTLTQARKPEILDQLQERSLPALAEMARWKHLPHALPAFILLGRIVGMKESDLQAAWSKGEREPIIDRAVSLGKRPAPPGRP
jgi:hypothetical protein